MEGDWSVIIRCWAVPQKSDSLPFYGFIKGTRLPGSSTTSTSFMVYVDIQELVVCICDDHEYNTVELLEVIVY